MDKRETIQQLIYSEGLLPLFYHDDVELCKGVVKALYDAGVRIVEFTNRGKNAIANFKALVEERNVSMPGLMLGIGTIKTSEDATNFIDAGADVLISPTFNSGVADVAYMNKILWIPGCMTPTEISAAENAGCTLIKLFPGNVLGPSFVQAIKPLFPDLKFVVTGGVETSKENLASWFKAGVAGVGMGSKLITEKLLADKDYTSLTNSTKEVLHIIQSLRK